MWQQDLSTKHFNEKYNDMFKPWDKRLLQGVFKTFTKRYLGDAAEVAEDWLKQLAK